MSLGANELERMREERKQLQEEIKMERHVVETTKKEKQSLETDVLKLKTNRDQHSRKLK